MKLTLLLSLLFFFYETQTLYSQNFEFGKISPEELNLKKTPFDSTANAVVLREFGTANIQIDEDRGNSYISYDYHVKIKILNKQGFKHANIEIPLWIYDRERFDDLEMLTATTMNFTENGLVKTDLDQKKVFNEKRTKYLSLKKFTMPNIMEGSIIEYKYRIKRPYIFNFVTWEFQSDIPKLHSQFVGFLPAIYNFNASIRGFYKLSEQKGEINKGCLRIRGVDVDCSKMTYTMKNIPAFIEEPYMTAASNYKSAIYFELSDIQNLNGSKSDITKTWKSVDYELTSERTFGGQMKKKDIFKEILPAVLENATDELSKAKAVFEYIRNNIKWNNFYGKYSENEIKKALDLRSGNIGDINLALIAALSAANLNVEALILSTRSNGQVNNIYPVISDFNYVVAKVNIGETSYLLDASQPFLPFGLLPHHCMNGRGRVISLKKESYWFELKAREKDAVHYYFDGELLPDGKIKGKLKISSYGYSAVNKREKIAAAGSNELYAEQLDEKMPNLQIRQKDIANVAQLDLPLQEAYEIEMQSIGDMSANVIYFNPYLFDKETKNPFNLNERSYPVDLGAVVEKRLTIKLKVPTNLTLMEQPKDITLMLPDNQARYLNKITFQPGEILLTQLHTLNKPIFEAQEYLGLKEFYSRLIQHQNTDLILKSIPE